jgi:hypothetical protein
MNRRSFLKLGLAATAASVIPAGTLYAVQSTELDITRHRVVLPGVGRRLRIVLISDLHGRPYYLPVQELIAAINDQKPDIFILAGDMIDRREDLDVLPEFRGVKAELLKVAVLGNWEHGHSLREVGAAGYKAVYAEAGIQLLFNSTFNIQNLTLFGLDDLVHGRPDFRGLDAALSRKGPALFITHCPAAFDRLPATAAAPVLAVSGHTHGGQIAPFGNAIVTPPGSGEYVHGWYRRGAASMYVTRGIGTSGVPIRIGARPEMVVMEVEGEGGGGKA